jgi:hypothetical protein
VTDLTTLMTTLGLGRGRSTALSTLLKLVGLLLVGMPLLKGMPHAIVMTVLVLLIAVIVVTLFAYIFLLFKDPDRLHSEGTYYQLRQMQHTLGDNRLPPTELSIKIATEQPKAIEGKVGGS